MTEDDAGPNAVNDAIGMRGGKRSFGDLTPSEAAQRRWSEARAQESGAEMDPLGKQRRALEKKAEAGDVYAIRELREHHDYWYGQADTQPLLALASPLQLQALHAIAVDVREGRRSAWLDGVAVPDPPLH